MENELRFKNCVLCRSCYNHEMKPVYCQEFNMGVDANGNNGYTAYKCTFYKLSVLPEYREEVIAEYAPDFLNEYKFEIFSQENDV